MDKELHQQDHLDLCRNRFRNVDITLIIHSRSVYHVRFFFVSVSKTLPSLVNPYVWFWNTAPVTGMHNLLIHTKTLPWLYEWHVMQPLLPKRCLHWQKPTLLSHPLGGNYPAFSYCFKTIKLWHSNVKKLNKSALKYSCGLDNTFYWKCFIVNSMNSVWLLLWWHKIGKQMHRNNSEDCDT